MINILDIPDQYFFVYDRERHEEAVDGLRAVDELFLGDTQEAREKIHKRLIPVIGFREAEALVQRDAERMKERLEEVVEKQLHLKAYLEQKFAMAAQRAARAYPEDFGDREVRRDAVFYTLSRAGLAVIGDFVRGETDWEKVAERISNGEQLERFLPSKIIRDVVALLPCAILFNEQRAELTAQLKQYNADLAKKVERALPRPVEFNQLDLPKGLEQQIMQLLRGCIKQGETFLRGVDSLAERLELDEEAAAELTGRLKRVVRGSTFRLARGLEELRHGRVDECVLSPDYSARSRKKWMPLAVELAKAGCVRRHDIEHVHTKNSSYLQTIYGWLRGRDAFSTRALQILDVGEVSGWSGEGSKLLDPQKVTERTAGLYVGYFLFGRGNQSCRKKRNLRTLSYYMREKSEEWFFDTLERTGTLVTRPSLGETMTGFGYVCRVHTIPIQFLGIAEYALETMTTETLETFRKTALQGWLEDNVRCVHVRKSGTLSMQTSIRSEYEGVIRQMAKAVGLNISRGSVRGNRVDVHVRNPEIVGYKQ